MATPENKSANTITVDELISWFNDHADEIDEQTRRHLEAVTQLSGDARDPEALAYGQGEINGGKIALNSLAAFLIARADPEFRELDSTDDTNEPEA